MIAFGYQSLDKEIPKQVEKVKAKQENFFQQAQCYSQLPANDIHKKLMAELDADLTRALASMEIEETEGPVYKKNWITSHTLQRKIAQRQKRMSKLSGNKPQKRAIASTKRKKFSR